MRLNLFYKFIYTRMIKKTQKQINNKNREVRFLEIKWIAQDIKTIKIQWATNIAKEAFKVMSREILKQRFKDRADFVTFFDKATHLLISARSTEPMLFNGMKYARSILNKSKFNDAEKLKVKVADAFSWFLEFIKKWDEYIYINGSKLVKNDMSILTHCHASSVVKLFRSAVQLRGKKFHVFNTETRPLYQWRVTSKDLLKEWIETTMITDSSAPYFVDNTIEKDFPINMVVIGCDAIKPNWNIINKVWSFSIAISAYNSKIPVYIVWNLLKTDYDNQAVIERRSWNELRPDKPKNLEIINLAFDTVPAKFITWIITEFGIIKPNMVKKTVEKRYPWMVK